MLLNKRLLALLLLASIAIAAVRPEEVVVETPDDEADDDDFDFAEEGSPYDGLLQPNSTSYGNLPPPTPGEYGSPGAYGQQQPTGNYGQQASSYSPQQPTPTYGGQEPSSYATPTQAVYPQPVNNYSQPATTYQQPASGYEQPAPVYQQQAPVYQQQAPTYQQQAPAYQQQASAYQQPAPAPAYQQPAPVYQAPAPVVQPAQVYQAPVLQQQVYTAPQQSNYTQIPAPVYNQPAYQPIQQQQPVYVQQQNNYSVPAPVYQPPPVQTQNYLQSQPVVKQQQNYAIPQAAPQVNSYQPPNLQTNYSKPIVVVQQQNPVYAPVVPALQQTTGYKQQPIVQRPQQQQLTNYVAQPRPILSNYNSTSASLPLISLLPFISDKNYAPNWLTTGYFKNTPYQACPKNVYSNGPSAYDIQEAFKQAQLQLNLVKNSTINYIDSTHQSFAARHAFFSFLNQHSPRMDEEGLLVEYVSQYLAQRACMTKWAKQRYLPTLTKLISTSHFPASHSCSGLYNRLSPNATKYCAASKYRSIDGFCNNPYHPYWGKSDVCHLRLMSPDYADGISLPRVSAIPTIQLPNPRSISNYVHFELPLDGLYNLMKMQWGQFINHDITNTALSSYDGLVDCCKNPTARGCYPIYVPPGDPFYSKYNVTCLNFIRSGVCALCQLGPRQQSNKNTAFLDLSHIYGNTQTVANKLRTFKGGLLITSQAKNGELLPPLASGQSQDQCTGICFSAGDNRINQHPTLTALHTLSLRRHNQHALALAKRHPDWNDEYLYQEARRLNIAEYQMITYNEYFPIVFGPMLSAYYNLYPLKSGHTYYNPKVDPTTWNEYSTAACRFGHSQIANVFGLYSRLSSYRQQSNEPSFRLKDWFMQPSFLYEGLTSQLITGLLSKPAQVVDPWITDDVREHLYKNPKDHSGGDLAATNIMRGRDHGIPGYINYLDFCFNYKVYSWKDLELFIPQSQLYALKKVYGVVENIDLFTGGLAERHFPGADTGPTFACINGIQYYHLKFGDRFYFEHGNQVGSFNPAQLQAIRTSSLARFLCRTAYLPKVPAYSFLSVSHLNPAVNCATVGELDYNLF